MESFTDRIDFICRLCLVLDERSTLTMDNENFRYKLAAVCNILFTNNPQLPSKVCSECSTKIIEFHEYVESIRCNQEKLQSLIPSCQVKQEEILKNEVFLPCEVVIKQEIFEDLKDEAIDSSPAEEMGNGNVDEDAESDSQHETSKDDVESSNATEVDRVILACFTMNCDSCTQMFKSFGQLKQHCKQLHGRKPILQCVKCNKTFQQKFKLLRHANSHLKPFKCEICGKGFVDRKPLLVHQSIKHSECVDNAFKCDTCPRSFEKESHLRSHLKLHDRVDCQICGKNLSNPYILKTHMSTMHSTGERQFICDVCGKEFKARGAMESHMVVHKTLTPEDGARCEICNTWFIRKRRLRRHMIEIHESKESECDVCHKMYPNTKAMVNHKRIMHGGQTFDCEICGKQFRMSVSLKEHRASAHTGEKLYACEFCGLQMNSKSNLYQHRKNKHPLEWMEGKKKAAMLIV